MRLRAPAIRFAHLRATLPKVTVRGPALSLDIYLQRRARIAAALGDGVLLLHGGELRTRSNDTQFRFRPDSDFYYLTGLADPGAILVFRPGHEPETVLFLREHDPDSEVWTGKRVGPEGASDQYGADEAHPLSEFQTKLPDLIDGAHSVHVPLGRTPKLDRRVVSALGHLRQKDRYGKKAPESLMDARAIVGEDRLIKDDAALSSLRQAVDLSVDAHITAMKAVHPGMHEYEIEALIEYWFRRHGSTGPGYGSIVGAGANATILHYVENRDELRDGQILLVDAGAEWDYFSGDLTRSYPVSGRFTPPQKDLYEVVLAANEAGIEQAVVGNNIDAIHDTCLRILCEGLRELGVLDGPLDQILEEEAYKPYYMHRTSHWLGADVHDAGHYCIDRVPRPLQAGFVLTIEPAIYVAADDERAPTDLQGTGIRIEDDVLIRPDGPEVLTHRAPKTVAELESILGTEPRVK